MAVMQFGVTPITKLSRSRHDNEYVHKSTTYNKGDFLSKTSGNLLTTNFAIKLWGQPFDGASDITGDLQDVGNITASGWIRANALYQDGHFVLDNDNSEVAENYVKIFNTTHYFLGTDPYGNINHDVHIDGDLYVNGDGSFDDVTLDTLTAQTVHTHELTADIAHFFELQIDKIKAVGGTVIVTPANFRCDLVEQIEGGYRCYQKAYDDTTQKGCDDLWDDGDQAICASFNATEGTSYNVSNKWYWCAVTGHGRTTVNDEEYLYIDLSSTDKESACTVNPEVGDEIVQLGNKTQAARQNAIIITAYRSPDSTVGSPSITQYKGINDYVLSTHKVTVISPQGNIFRGEFHIETGENIEDLINNGGGGQGTSTTSYVHFAWADNATGQGFTKNPAQADGKAYLGVCTNTSQDESTLIWSDYTWMRVKGDPGQDGQNGTSTGDGQNACRLDLDNENDSVIETPDGKIVQATLPTTNALFFDGNSIVTMSEANLRVTPTGCDYTKTGYTYNGVQRGFTFKITTVTNTTFSLKVEYHYNSVWYGAIFNGKKLVGTQKWEIITTPTVVRLKADGTTFSHQSIKVDVYKTDSQGVRQRDTTITAASQRLRYYLGTSTTANYLNSGGTVAKDIWKNVTSVTFELYDQNNVICDKETVPIVADGENGKSTSSITTFYKAYATEGSYSRSDGGADSWKQWISSTDWSETKRYLYAYQYWVFSDGSETYTNTYLASVWGKNGKDGGEAGTDGQDGQPGRDAEFYMLVAERRNAIVTKHDVLTLDFRYKVVHVKGEDIEEVANIQNAGFKIRHKSDVSDATWNENYTYNANIASYSNDSVITDYHRANPHPKFYTVQLCDSTNTPFDTDIVNVQFDAGAALDIADDIRSYVQDVEGNLSTITQKATLIETRVNDLDNNFSQLQQTVDGFDIGTTRAAGTNIMRGVGNGKEWTLYGDESAAELEFEPDEVFGYYTFHLKNKKFVGSGNYSDVNLASPVVGVEPGQKYTLSLWYYATGPAGNDWLYFKNNGHTNESCRGWLEVYGSTTQNISLSSSELITLPSTVIYANRELIKYREDDFYRYSITFETKRGTTGLNYIKVLFHNRQYSGSNSASVLQLRNIQLERGEEATGFALDKAYSESLIKETADAISLRVTDAFSSAGIDIDSQTITLDAHNTKIIGNLGLYETDNGFTVYDQQGSAKINIVPQYIGNIDDYSPGQQTFINCSGMSTTSGSTYSVTTEKRAVGYLTAGQVCYMSNFNCYLHAARSSNGIQDGNSAVWPGTTNIRIGIKMTRAGNSSWSTTQAYNAPKVSYSNYKYTGQWSFTPPTDDTYYVEFTLSSTDTVPVGYSQYANVNIKWQYYSASKTTVALDGFLSNQGVNKMLWSGQDAIAMQWDYNGIRLDEHGLQVGAGVAYNNANMDSTNTCIKWLSMYNYTPVYYVGTMPRVFTSTYIYHLSEYKPAYEINPVQDIGLCYVYGNYDADQWILLPPSIYYDAKGRRQSLPTGYTVTIINDTNRNLHVTTKNNVNGNDVNIIFDAHQNGNPYSTLQGVENRDTFIKIGPYWYQMRDTQ